jgi:glycosyltransferase involved in cell wall biosynthesis
MVKLSLCVIVGKNEAMELERLLKSAQGPLFDEIVVTTTQDDPEVKRVAEKYADKVPHFDWVHDFSAARNFCFDKASGNYIMWLDADDEISSQAYNQLVEIKGSLPNYDYALIGYSYAQDAQGHPVILLPRERIVRNTKELRWVDPIHEFISTHSGHRLLDRPDIIIHHRRTRAYDPSRNLSILKKVYDSGKASARNAFYYAKDLFENGFQEEAVGIFEKYLQNDGCDYYQNMAVACFRMAEYCNAHKDIKGEIKWLQKSLTISTEYAEPYYKMGVLFEDKGDIANAISMYEIAASKKADGLFGAKVAYHTLDPRNRLVLIYDKMRKYAKAYQHAEWISQRYPDDKNYQFNMVYLRGKLEEPPAARYVRNLKDRSNISLGWPLSFVMEEDPSQRIRRLNISEELRRLGVHSVIASGYNSVDDIKALAERWSKDFDIMIFSSFTQRDVLLARECSQKGLIILVDINEDIMGYPQVREMLGVANGVVVCSTALVDKLKGLAKRVMVIEDAVEAPEEEYDYNLPEREGKPVALFMGMGGNSFLVTDYLKDVIEEAGYQLEVCTEWDNATVPWHLDTWRKTMNNCHVVLCPQRVEVQPAKSNIKAAQAMSFGIPVIASPLPAYKEFISNGENGFLCETKAEWKEALIKLKDKKLRELIGKKGRETAEGFSLRNMTNKWVTAVETLYPILIKEGTTFVKPIEEGNTPTPPATIPIIIPVYNEVEYLKACVTSIHMNTTLPYQIVLSDAGSGEETWRYLDTLKGISIIGRRGVRKSFSEAVNDGVRSIIASSTYFVVLNSDVLVSSGWLESLVGKMTSVDRLAACGVLSNCDRGWLHGAPGTPQYPMTLPKSNLELVPGMKYSQVMPHLDELNSFMAESNTKLNGTFVKQKWVAYYATIFAKSAWEEVGYLDPLFKNGCEDLDHCRRLQSMNYEIGQAMDSFVYHFGGISRGAYQNENRESYDKEDSYNHKVYAKKWEKKRVAIYTGPAWEKWNRDTVDKGMAGSETWASELGASLVAKGYAVTLFNDCPVDGEVDKYGVEYRFHDKFAEWLSYHYVDHVILSRTCYPLQTYKVPSLDVSVMVHDVFINSDKNYDTKAWAVRRFACLSDWHIDFFSKHHSIPREKIVLTANGVRPELYAEELPKENMAVYSSSPDRGLHQLLMMVPEIRKEVPDFKLVVAYGFHNWKAAAQQRNNPKELEYIKTLEDLLAQPGVEYVGRADKETLAKYQLRAKVWLYPTWFSETFCITLIENGFAGNAAVTVPYAGILTTGGSAPVYIQGPDGVEVSQWCYDGEYLTRFAEEAVLLLKDEEYRLKKAAEMKVNALKYTWEAVAGMWVKEWGGPQT